MRCLIQLRKRMFVLVPGFDLTLDEFLRHATITWHGTKLAEPDLSDDSHTLAFTAYTHPGEVAFHFIANSYWEPLTFELPPLDEKTST